MRTGFSKIDITPPLGCTLCGQLIAPRAKGIQSQLYATAMCISDGKKNIAFVSCDILLISNELAKEISEEASVDEVIVAATHTHSGPAPIKVFGGNENNVYLHQMKAGILKAISEASAEMHESCLKFSNSELKGLAFNRRFVMNDDSIQTHPLKKDPKLVRAEGPDNSDLNVIWSEDIQGKLLGGMVIFGCHATVMERDNDQISSDFPGETTEFLENKFGAPFLFMQSACGNICQVNTFDDSQSEVGVDWIKKMGNEIGSKAESMIKTSSKAFESNILTISQTVMLPRRKVPEDLAKWAKNHSPFGTAPIQLSDYGSEIFGTLPENKVSLENFFSTLFWSDFYANEIKTRQKDFEREPEMPFSFKVIKLGELAIVTLPCELFIEWQNLIKQNSPFTKTIVIELANGWNGYIPTKEAFIRSGGYETKEVTSTMLIPEAGDIIYTTIMNELKNLKEK